MTIRDAGPADAATIADLHVASWRSAYRGIMPDSFLDGPVVADRRAHWDAMLARPPAGAVVLLAEAAGQPMGFIAAYPGVEPGWDVSIDNLHVRPGRRGGGLGRLLLGAAADRLAARGLESVCLWAFSANRAGIRFYERLGGRTVETGFDTVDGERLPHQRIAWHDLAGLARACSTERPPARTREGE